jgi:catechol 2,3-dioxygenase-like lactoylglutathione lyase family enzyme
MQHIAKSLRPFIGAKNYNESRAFYRELGFEEVVISNDMSLFKVTDALAFYLQDANVKDWIDNTMLFLEVEDVNRYYEELQKLGLHHKYKGVRLTPIREFPWGKECYLHDPIGILWHFGEFKK